MLPDKWLVNNMPGCLAREHFPNKLTLFMQHITHSCFLFRNDILNLFTIWNSKRSCLIETKSYPFIFPLYSSHNILKRKKYNFLYVCSLSFSNQTRGKSNLKRLEAFQIFILLNLRTVRHNCFYWLDQSMINMTLTHKNENNINSKQTDIETDLNPRLMMQSTVRKIQHAGENLHK